VAFPTIFPPVPEIEPMAVIPDVSVKLPDVNVTSPKESVAAVLVFPPKVMPPVPFKVKFAGYCKNILLGRVFAVVLVNATVPEAAVKWMLPVFRVTFPAMVNVLSNILNTPEFNANVPDDPTVTAAVLVMVKVPDEWVYVPFIAKVPVEMVTVPTLFSKLADEPNVNI